MYGEHSFEFFILEMCEDKSKLKLIEQKINVLQQIIVTTSEKVKHVI